MKNTTLRTLLIAFAAALALALAGCKGESSPTAPPNTSTVLPGSPGITPPNGASIVLTVSNANPLVSSRVTVTATVTANGTAVPDGTAVQFTTTLGTFADTGTTTTIRTTTNGVATASLSSAAAGAATVTATVNNVSKNTTVTFSTAPVTPPPPNTAPTISSVCVITGTTCTTPATGIPAGGQQVLINGTNFRAPVRVLFDPGNGQPAKEAFVNSVTATQISVTAPPFDIITGQTLPVTITVIDEAGTANEQKASLAAAFTYQLAVLTPSVRTLTPTSGPIDGGTRVSILGDAFQAPVQVFFNAAEAQVISVNFNEIVVMSPTARDTNPNASGTVTGPVDIKVRNVASGKEATFPAGFRYIAKMQITAAGPTSGSAFGGTRVTIDGVGFNDPIAVTVAGVAAQPIKVSGTQVVVITGRAPVPCTPPTAPIIITNVDNGDQATGPAFSYAAEKPFIISVTPSSGAPGTSTTIRVGKPGVGVDGTGVIRMKIGSSTVTPTPTVITDPIGPIDFSAVVPNFTFSTETCTTSGGLAGTRLATPAPVDVVFTNLTTGCTDTLSQAFTITPPGPNTCTPLPAQPPPVAQANPSSFCPNGFGSITVGGSNPQVLVIKNGAAAGAQSLNASLTITGTNADQFSVNPASATVAPGAQQGVTVTFTPTSPGLKSANLVILTNDPTTPQITVCLQGTGL
jgi:Abnormal spindle-like microcephaly-assoc'd, ASPM-SPD-2-Hydin/IPT/TIG domain